MNKQSMWALFERGEKGTQSELARRRPVPPCDKRLVTSANEFLIGPYMLVFLCVHNAPYIVYDVSEDRANKLNHVLRSILNFFFQSSTSFRPNHKQIWLGEKTVPLLVTAHHIGVQWLDSSTVAQEPGARQ